jgi:FAD/FMN-containing dehydrogenase
MRALCGLLAMNILRALAVLVLVSGSDTILSGGASAQEIRFDQINKFESFGTGTLRVGAPPKTIIDDGERHLVAWSRHSA